MSTRLFGVDQMLPSQFFTPVRADTPERRLMLAALEGAIHDLRLPVEADKVQDPVSRTYTKKCRTAAQEKAVEWFWDDDLRYSYSFRNCCDQLDINTDALRERLFNGVPPPILNLKRRYAGDSNMKARVIDLPGRLDNKRRMG